MLEFAHLRSCVEDVAANSLRETRTQRHEVDEKTILKYSNKITEK